MKLYRVEYLSEGGCSAGFSWHTSKQEAKKFACEAVKEMPEEYEDEGPVITETSLVPTKPDILDFLNSYASYPDNG